MSDLPHLSLLDTITSRWQDTFQVFGRLLSLVVVYDQVLAVHG